MLEGSAVWTNRLQCVECGRVSRGRATTSHAGDLSGLNQDEIQARFEALVEEGLRRKTAAYSVHMHSAPLMPFSVRVRPKEALDQEERGALHRTGRSSAKRPTIKNAMSA